MELTYWKFRGCLLPVRLLLAYNKDTATCDQVQCEEPLAIKLITDHENLTLTDSNAISRFFARRHGQLGTTTTEEARVDSFGRHYYDMYEEIALISRSHFSHFDHVSVKGDFEKIRKRFLALVMPLRLAQMHSALGDKSYYCGEKVTLADFQLYDVLDLYERFERGSLESYPQLKAFKARFESLGAVEEFIGEESEWIARVFPESYFWCG